MLDPWYDKMDMQDHNFEMVYFNSTRDKPKLGYRGFVYQRTKIEERLHTGNVKERRL